MKETKKVTPKKQRPKENFKNELIWKISKMLHINTKNDML